MIKHIHDAVVASADDELAFFQKVHLAQSLVFRDGDGKGFHARVVLQAIEVCARRWLIHDQDAFANV
jgi:hypothetical protein